MEHLGENGAFGGNGALGRKWSIRERMKHLGENGALVRKWSIREKMEH